MMMAFSGPQRQQRRSSLCVITRVISIQRVGRSVSQRLGFIAVILALYNFSTHPRFLLSPFPPRISFPFWCCIMASQSVFGNVLRCSAKLATASSARSSRCFASQASNWASQSTAHAGRALAPRSQHPSRLVCAATPLRRAFSSSPASRHGHLDKPKPGEECVQACTCHTHPSLLTIS